MDSENMKRVGLYLDKDLVKRGEKLDSKKFLTVIMMIRSGYVSKLVVSYVAEEVV